jgi:hypothetical protein
MAKPTRRQRKAANFKHFVVSTFAASVLLATGAATAAEPVLIPEPVPVIVVTLASKVSSNDQGEQLTEMKASPEGRSPAEIQVAINEIDQARLLDRRFRDYLNQKWFTEDDVMSALYYVTFSQFLQRYGRIDYGPIALVRDDLRNIGGIFLTDARGWRASTAGEELWSRFRYRMRREGALVRICENKILTNNNASGPRLRIASRAA